MMNYVFCHRESRSMLFKFESLKAFSLIWISLKVQVQRQVVSGSTVAPLTMDCITYDANMAYVPLEHQKALAISP